MVLQEVRAVGDAGTIQDMLTEWARWHRADKGIGYPSRATWERLRGSSIPEPHITDDLAVRVDGAVARLRVRCPDQAEVLTQYYLARRSLSRIARTLKQDRRAAAATLKSAENAVDWILHLTETTP